MVIKSSGPFWRVPRGQIPPPPAGSGKSRAIRLGSLIDLVALQALLRSGGFDTDQLWIATDKCDKDLRKEGWSTTDVLHMLCALTAADYYKSEWCEDRHGHWEPCDAYRLPYDVPRQCRAPRSGLRVYLKFSIDDDAVLTIALVSCHEG